MRFTKREGHEPEPEGLSSAEPAADLGLRRAIVDDEGGFTSLGVVVALLLTVSLVLASSRVYWVESRAADIQFAADAGALASENVVANYLTAAHVVDAALLSMSLLGLSFYAVSAVVALIPAAGPGAAGEVSQLAHRVMSARDKFAESSTKALDQLQKALPFLCAYNALVAIQANGNLTGGKGRSSAVGLAIPLPLEGISQTTPSAASIEQVGETADHTNPRTEELAREAEQSEQEMGAQKLIAYQADCGNNPGYCLYQRTATLSSVPASSNPYYASVDGWSFSAPLERARAYYRARLTAEPGRDGQGDFSNPAEAVRSIARARFYAYALQQLEQGSVTEADGVVTADLPLLPENTDDMRATALYTEEVWPLTSGSEGLTLHASWACPQARAEASAGLGSLASQDAGAFGVCPVCGFTIADLGHAPAASTAIDNGFEHYWRAIAQAARSYSEASARFAERGAGAKQGAGEVIGAFDQALRELAAPRYEAQPPGRYGSIAIALDLQAHEVPLSTSGLSGGSTELGRRIALSAATLAPDDASLEDNLISSLTAGLSEEVVAAGSGTAGASGVASTLLSGITGVWGTLLFAYGKGTDGLLEGLGSVLSKLPGGGTLSAWAEQRLREVIELAGLQPADLALYKPVLCNSLDVATRANGDVSASIGRLRTLESMMGSTGLAGLVDSLATQARERFDAHLDQGITFSIKVVDIEGFPEVPVTVRLPAGVKEAGDRAIRDVFGRIGSWVDGFNHTERVWR